MAEFTLKPIGIFRGSHKNKSSLPRQGHLSQQEGFIRFEKKFDFKLALTGLEKFSHVWLIFLFHKSESQPKPLVRPPRKPEIQVGVWATRSPYRPNSLGLTLARIQKIEAGRLFLAGVDLLDETPILDIKPYVTESDSATEVSQGWLEEIETWKFKLSAKAKTQKDWLKNRGLPEIDDVLESQFGTPPLQPKRKRVQSYGEKYILAYRTWRFVFKVDSLKKTSEIISIHTGYSKSALLQSDDPYQDKKLHKDFVSVFSI